MKITAYELTDFKRIKSVRIEPGETALVVIGGNNGQGKSSLLDGLTTAFGGKRHTCPAPVRKGAKHAEIKVELDGGALTIKRRIAEDGTQTLELYDESGKQRSPQRMLDDLVGSRFLDPLAFVRMSAKDQRTALIDCTVWPDGFSYGKWLLEYDEAFSARTEVNRAAKNLAAVASEAEGKRPVVIPEAPDTTGLMVDLDRLMGEQRRRAEARRAASEAQTLVEIQEGAIARQVELVARATERLASLRDELVIQKGAAAELASRVEGDSAADIEADIEKVKEEIAGATEKQDAHRAATDATVAADRAHAVALAAADDAVSANAAVVELRKAFDAAWSEAKTPVAGVEWDDTQVILGGVPFWQASDSDQLRAALAIAMACSPDIEDIWIKDGSLLDETSLALVREAAEADGYRVWIERVGESDADAIIIREGAITVSP